MGTHYEDSHVVITFTTVHNIRYCSAGVYFLILDVAPTNRMSQEELLHVVVVKYPTQNKKPFNHHSNQRNADLVCYLLRRNKNLRNPTRDRLS